MPNIASVLKEEIRRLARKEVKSEVGTLRRTVSQHRREIARLKKELDASRRVLSRKVSQVAKGHAEEVSLDEPRRFSARSVRAQRRRLKLSAQEYGQLVGVSGQTIYLWEQGKTRPRQSQFESLIAVRGIGRREALAQLSKSGASNGRPKRRRRARKPR